MTGAREAALQTTQMKMLKPICVRRRKTQPNGELEPWVDWIRDATAYVRGKMVLCCVTNWVSEQQCRIKSWAGKLQSMGEDRWAKEVLHWQLDGFRTRGHPRGRWVDQLRTLTLKLSPQGM